MALSFTHLWQQQEHSDVDVILKTVDSPDQDAPSDRNQLATFPAHSVLLSNSQVFQAQVLRWQDRQQPPAKKRRTAAKKSTPSTDGNSRPQLVLELQDTSEQTAALAVLSSLYLAKPLPELLSELTQEQQLQAAVLADKWQVPNVSTAATQLLMDALNTDGRLSEAVKQQVMSAAALPDCLQPLLRRVLLSVLGDLEAVWACADLQDQLLGLQLPAMELLLSCDELKVATEDTVLYTVQQYLKKISNSDQQEAAADQLSKLVRCQHLPQFWLSTSLVSDAARTMALSGLRPQLNKLLMLRCAKPNMSSQPSGIPELVPGAPASWGLGLRESKPVASVSMTWNLVVSKMQEAALRSAADKEHNVLWSRPCITPPIGGMSFKLYAKCAAVDAGCKVGVYVTPGNVPGDAYYSFVDCWLTTPGLLPQSVSHGNAASAAGDGYGIPDYFGLGVMAGGWDEAAWAAKGLPASGQLPITLTVTRVAHMEAPVPPVPAPAPAPAAFVLVNRRGGRARGRGR